MGFQLTADAFSYVYAKAIHKALELIEKDMNDGNDPRDKWSASERPMMLKRDLPEPLACDPLYCTLDDPPGCLNFEVSHNMDQKLLPSFHASLTTIVL
jgi:hypothetical protein